MQGCGEWNRREWGERCAAALLGATVSAAPMMGQAGAIRPLTHTLVVAVADKSAFCLLPLTVAERLGFFAAEGVAVEVVDYPDTAAAMNAVNAGSAHMLSGPFSLLVDQRLRGEFLTSIFLQGVAPQLVLGVSHRTMEHYRSLRDLRGRRIGVTALGSGSHRVARLALARASLGSQDVIFVPLPDAQSALGAFQSGDVDAICYSDPVITRLEQAGTLRVLIDTRTLRGSTDLFGGPLPGACLAAPPAWVLGNEVRCQAAANALAHALKWLQTAGPSDIVRAVPEAYFQGDRALYLAAFERGREAWGGDGVMPVNGPQTVARVLAKFSVLPEMPSSSLKAVYTNQFALKSKARFKI